MEMTSYSQASVALRTAATIFAAVNSGPEGTLSRSALALIPILILLPPTSMTKIFIWLVSISQVGYLALGFAFTIPHRAQPAPEREAKRCKRDVRTCAGTPALLA